MISKNIINLEINELPPSVLKEYILQKPNSVLSKLEKANKLKIISTLANDIEKKDLYPSQTWASFNTGLPFKKHKCYWYSDPLDVKKLFWNKLVKLNVSIGIVGSLHSSKYPFDLNTNSNYKFYLPDSFTDEIRTKPNCYKSFCILNSKFVSSSARVTNPLKLLLLLLKNIHQIIINPKKFGISRFSLKEIFKIIYWSIKSRNKEYLRMAQFPLLCSIYLDQLKNNDAEYSSIFTNHLAGNMHRYWYAYNSKSFIYKNRYKEKWIKRNKYSFFFAIDLIDDFIKEIIKLNLLDKKTIILTSSMGQEPNPKFDYYKLAKFDAKISNFEKFIDKFYLYLKSKNIKINNKIRLLRNMAPQYGIEVLCYKREKVVEFAKNLSEFIDSIDLESKIDINNFNITLTIDIAGDAEFQKKYTLNKAKNKYCEFGFTFSEIEDHHSGAHCSEGTFAIIGKNSNLEKILVNNLNNNRYLDYLNVSDMIIENFKK